MFLVSFLVFMAGKQRRRSVDSSSSSSSYTVVLLFLLVGVLPMATSNGDGGGNTVGTVQPQPPKAFERARTSPSDSPFKPPSTGRTSDVVEASGTAGEVVPANISGVTTQPPRSWEMSNVNGYGGMNYNSGYGSGMYGRPYGGLSNYGYRAPYGGSSMYGGSGMYGGGMYGGSGMYGGGTYGGSGMYGGGMYGGYGMGGMGGPYNQDPNNPSGAPAQPPGFWVSLLRVMEGVVSFFSKISMLVDMNTQALNGFMYAMLQLLNSSGHLYGELAVFVFRLLGIKRKPRKQPQVGGPPGHPMLGPGTHGQQLLVEGPKTPAGSFDSIWGNDANKAT